SRAWYANCGLLVGHRILRRCLFLSTPAAAKCNAPAGPGTRRILAGLTAASTSESRLVIPSWSSATAHMSPASRGDHARPGARDTRHASSCCQPPWTARGPAGSAKHTAIETSRARSLGAPVEAQARLAEPTRAFTFSSLQRIESLSMQWPGRDGLL